MPSSLFDPDTLMQASELQVLQNEYQKALQEPPWDGYCGLVKVSEDESTTKPASDPSSTRDAVSVSGSSDMPEPGPDSQQSQPPPGMQYAEQTANQPAAVTAGYSDNPEASEQLLLKLTSLQTAVALSDAGRQGQQCRIADEAFSNAVQLLEKGQVPAAINLLKVAQAACPDNKPQAQARIILLLARCQELAAPKHSTAVHSPAAPPTPAPLFASNGSTANTAVPQPRLSSPEVTDGDAQKAERAFEAGLASLQGGDIPGASEHLQAARKWCPRNQAAALIRIQRLIKLVAAQQPGRSVA